MNLEERISEIEKQLSELKELAKKEPISKDGWYKNKFHKYFCAYKRDGEYIYGINCFGEWLADFSNRGEEYHNDKSDILATDEEVKSALIKEAEKRGFKVGVKIKRDHFKLSRHTTVLSDAPGLMSYESDYNRLSFLGVYVFEDGLWAEIIKDEPLKVCGHEVKFDAWEIYIIGSKKIGKQELLEIKKVMEFNNFNTISFDNYSVTLEEINKILNL